MSRPTTHVTAVDRSPMAVWRCATRLCVISSSSRIHASRWDASSESPGWAESERYDIVATAPGHPTDFGPFIQTLSRDRFGMRARTETRPTPAYVLTVASTDGTLGPRLGRGAFPNC